MLGVVCLLTGLFFNFYIERKPMPDFHYYYYYYINQYVEYMFPTVLTGVSLLIIGTIVLGLSLHMNREIENS